MDTDRNKIIETLKTVKDPEERDRLLWALSGLEKDVKAAPPRPTASEQTESAPTPGQELNIPQLPTGMRNRFVYFVPGLFIIFGISNLLGALAHILANGRVERVISQLIMGAIFLVFGMVSLKKVKRKIAQPDQETHTKIN